MSADNSYYGNLIPITSPSLSFTPTLFLVEGSTGNNFNIQQLGSTYTINLPSSSSSNRGLLTSADWTLFNAKQGALTLTTTGTGGAATLVGNTLNIPQYANGITGTGIVKSTSGTISYITDNSSDWDTAYTNRITSASAPLSISVNAISISQANSTTDGYLSSTDWTTFNNKQNTLTNPVTGTGTANSIPMFTGTTSVGNAPLTIGTSGEGLSIEGEVLFGGGSLNFKNYSSVTTKGTGYSSISTNTSKQFIFSYEGSASVIFDLTNITGGKTYTMPNVSGTLVTGTGTLNQLTYFTATNTIGSLSTATYPSLTELSYVKGVTSAIQTQLNGKQATLTNPITGTGTSGQVAYFNGTTAQTGSNNLFWDNTNGRLGVGTASPGYNLHVVGSIRLGTNPTILIDNATGAISYNAAGNGNHSFYGEGNGTFLVSTTKFSNFTNRSTTSLSYLPIILASTNYGSIIIDHRYSGTATLNSVSRLGLNASYADNFIITSYGNAINHRGGHISILGGDGNANVGGDIYISGGSGTSAGNIYLGVNYQYNGLAASATNSNVSIGTTTSSSYKLDVNGTSRYNGQTTLTGSVTAAANLAQGVIVTPTLTTSNVGDFLIGLDISPTFSNPIAYGNVTNLAIRTNSAIQIGGSITSTSGGISSAGIVGTSAISATGVVTASAANNILVGLDVSTTFNSAGFTGVSSFFARFANTSGGTSLPATTGTAQTGGILRLGRDNGVLDIGSNSASGAWLQSTNRNDLSLGYVLYLNPNGGNVAIGTTSPGAYKLDVNGTSRISGVFTASSTGSFGGTLSLGDGLRINGGYTSFNSSTIFGSSAQSGNTFNFNTQYVGAATGATNYFNFTGTLSAQTGGSFVVFNVAQTLSNTNSAQSFKGFYYNPTITGLVANTTHYSIETVTGDVYLASTSGTVGIGTAPTSTYKLDVNGTARVSGALTVSGAAINISNNQKVDWSGNGLRSTGSNNLIFHFGGSDYHYIGMGGLCINSGGGGSAPVGSSVLELVSTSKGFLPPRMTGAQGEAISSPAAGLMIYTTSAGSGAITSAGWWGYNGTTWVLIK